MRLQGHADRETRISYQARELAESRKNARISRCELLDSATFFLVRSQKVVGNCERLRNTKVVAICGDYPQIRPIPPYFTANFDVLHPAQVH